MKKNNKIIFIIITSLFFFTNIALSADYVPLESGENSLWSKLDINSGTTTISTTNLADFLSKVFNFGIAIAVLLSFIMITVGGVEYMTTDSWYKKEAGKSKIKNALLGLILALVSWLILFTINPCLVTLRESDQCGGNSLIK